MSDKTDKKVIKALIKQAKEIDQQLSSALNAEKSEIANLRRAADTFLNEKMQDTLQSMDVDMLSQGKQKIRVSYLHSAGINTIGQLAKLSRQQIEGIDGIGVQGAAKIYDLTRQIVGNTRTKLSLRINADNPSKADDLLVRALYCVICHEQQRTELKRLYEQHHKPLIKEINSAKKAGSSFSWFFASKKEREDALTATATIKERLQSEFGQSIVLNEYFEVGKADITECYAHFREHAADYYSTIEKYCKQLSITQKTNSGLPEDLVKAIEAMPLDLSGLKATLRSYQDFGVRYAVHQKRTLLGDEMGLGKTIQAIATMIALKAAGKHHFMVVCPASVLINWCREIQKFSDMEVTKIHGADEEALGYWRANGDIAVTTYESISRFDLPEKFTFDFLVVDEAHYVKNPEAQRTLAMQKLLNKTEGVLYMSGTPLVNKVDEMCFLVSSLQPQIAERLEQLKVVSTAEQFRNELSGVYLRRVREDVLKELPELIEKEQWCELGTAERQLYRDAVASGNLMAIRQVSWQVSDLKDSTKAMRLLEICENAREQGRKVIVFSFFRNTLEKVKTLLGNCCSEIISGDISPAKRQEIVDHFNSAQEGAVLVSQVQAGGTGLNIQAASVVVFCEPQLTPAIENQAVARAYRMGQTRDVLVYRLLADETIDERMLEILSGKQKEFDAFADDSVIGDIQMQAESNNAWITKMVEDEQKRILQ
jgi:SNF2 family DNA or RNA helicase